MSVRTPLFAGKARAVELKVCPPTVKEIKKDVSVVMTDVPLTTTEFDRPPIYPPILEVKALFAVFNPVPLSKVNVLNTAPVRSVTFPEYIVI